MIVQQKLQSFALSVKYHPKSISSQLLFILFSQHQHLSFWIRKIFSEQQDISAHICLKQKRVVFLILSYSLPWLHFSEFIHTMIDNYIPCLRPVQQGVLFDRKINWQIEELLLIHRMISYRVKQLAKAPASAIQLRKPMRLFVIRTFYTGNSGICLFFNYND